MTGPRKTVEKTPEFIEPVAPEAVAPKDEPSENPDNEPVPEPVSENPHTDEPVEWFPGRPCLNCGARDYKVTIGWGTKCDKCLDGIPEEDPDGDS